MTTDDPWHGLAPGSIDARRVSGEGRHDFFWITSGLQEPGLLLRLPGGLEDPPNLPKLRSLDIGMRDIPGGRALVIILKDPEQREIFASLCQNVVGAAEAALETEDALSRALRRLMRWHHLLRAGRADLLSLEEQRGLLGELMFLERLAALVGARAAIEAWRGPLGASKDFEIDDVLVEVKARRGAAKPHVQISSEDQLSGVDGARLILSVSAVDAAIKPDGMTLNDHVIRAEKIFAEAGTESFLLWEEAIQAAGFDHEDDYSQRRWKVGPAAEYEVKGGFPRIVPPLIAGVSAVRYSISLEACAPYQLEKGFLDELIGGGGRQ